MLLDETPNTLGFLLLGYAFLFGLPLLYVASLLLRHRNLEQDVDAMRTLAEDEKQPEGEDSG